MLDVIRRHYPEAVLARGGREIQVCCRRCGDKRFNLEVNPAKGVFHCWRCGYSGLARFLVPGVSGRGFVPPRRPPSDRNRPAVPRGTIPYVPFSESPDGFLAGRCRETAIRKIGRGTEPPATWGVGKGPLWGFLVIPIVDGGETAAWIARGILRGPKYLASRSPPWEPVGGLFYRTSGAGKTVMLVEGVFDAESASALAPHVPVWATLGTVLTEGRLNRLLCQGVREALLWYDPDEGGRRGALSGAAALSSRGIRVRIAEEGSPEPKQARRLPAFVPFP